jgi:hypothetical protein
MWVEHQKERERLLEQLRLEAELQRLAKEESDRRAADRIRQELAEIEAREAARREREERKKREEERAKMRKSGTPPKQAKFKNPRHSPCHPSRESLFFRLPPLALDADNLISNHLARMNKSLPLELINPKPFSKSSRLSIRDPEFRMFTPANKLESSISDKGYESAMQPENISFATRKRYLIMAAGFAAQEPHVHAHKKSGKERLHSSHV